MRRDWKPGDVALVRNEWNVWNEAIYAVRPGGFVWIYGVSDSTSPPSANARPLVVIDPDDREQVERLLGAYRALSEGYAELMDEPWSMPAMRLRQALRSLTEPPKPPEPMGDGAVVEDRQGHRWVRIAGPPPECESKPWRHRGRTARTWDHVMAVRVLSEGVPS